MSIDGGRYLFIRILEACNADCFMCGFARSEDAYRLSPAELEAILSDAWRLGFRYLRFTGGEPLLHRELGELITRGVAHGLEVSIISNGSLVARRMDLLASAGLHQLIVSLDGATARSHDGVRGSPGLFRLAVDGLRKAAMRGISTRVNTVVGPHNYEEMPALQEQLQAMGVRQWELSSLKLGRAIAYPDRERVIEVCEPLYGRAEAGRLVPLGMRFYGETEEERSAFLERGVTPRASAPTCWLVGQVLYLDARAGRGYGCSLLPHRDLSESMGGVLLRQKLGWQLDTAELRDHVAHFRAWGPQICTGCSTTAAGFSDLIAGGGSPPPWGY